MGLRFWILGDDRAVREVLAEKYTGLCEWLSQFNHLTDDEIRENLPNIYQDIQNAIERLDSAFLAEDITAFEESLSRVKKLYAKALLRCGRKATED